MNPRAIRYGAAHKRLRTALVAQYEAGDLYLCALCRKPMTGDSSLLDLAHAPGGRGYLGLAHRRCNRGEGQAAINRARAARERLGAGLIGMPERAADPRLTETSQPDPPGRSATRW